MESAKVEAVARKYLDSLYRIAVNYCKNRDDAEDAVQNAFLKLIKTETEFNNDEHIFRWLIKVTVNECKGVWRILRNHRTISIEDLTAGEEEEAAPMDNSSEEIISAHELWDAITGLPSKYSVVLHLYYYEGYSVNEIAEILDITPTNVQTRLMRGRDKLKAILPEGDY